MVASPDAIVSLDVSLTNSYGKHESITTLVDKAKTIVSLVGIAHPKDLSLYGDPVHILPYQDAIAGDFLTKPVFHSMPSYFKSSQFSYSDAQEAVRSILPQINKQRTLFICNDLHSVDAMAEVLRLTTNAPADIVTISGRDNNIDRDVGSTGAIYIVMTHQRVIGYDQPDLKHLVVCRRFANADQFVHITAKVLRPFPEKTEGHIWDFGDNHLLWEAEGLSVDDTYTQVGSDDKTSDVAGSDSENRIQKWINPVSDGVASRDLMRRERLIHVLRGIINSKSDSRSLAIGLFGRWGSGKSTLLELLRQQFSADKSVDFIHFNAWDNEHATSMAAALADSITQQIYARGGPLDRFWLLLKHRIIIKKDVIPSLTLSVLALLVTSFLIPVKKLDPSLEFLPGLITGAGTRVAITLALTVLLAVELLWKHPITEGIRSFLKQISYAEHIGLTRKLRDELRSLINACALRLVNRAPNWITRLAKINHHEGKKYVVIVDDLDRCTKQSVWNVIEATRLIADFREVVLVFAVDYRLLFDAISDRLNEKTDSPDLRAVVSREFLGKILQLSIQLPEPSSATVATYIMAGLFRNDAPPPSPSTSWRQNQTPVTNALLASSNHMPAASKSEEFSSLDEPFEPAYEMSDDYLAGTPEEAAVFAQCAAAFSVSNPRTLLRLYNSMVLTKGLHPEIDGNRLEYGRQLFYIFFLELIASNICGPVDLSKFMLQDDYRTDVPLLNAVRRFGKDLGLFDADNEKENDRALQRALCTSLPLCS